MVLDGMLSRSVWKLNLVPTLQDACEKLSQSGASTIITDADLPRGRSWRDLVRLTQGMTPSPPVIVVSQPGDERLWAEVLNLGGFDVLLRPFDSQEVLHTVSMAGRNWRDRIALASAQQEALAQSRGFIQNKGRFHRAQG